LGREVAALDVFGNNENGKLRCAANFMDRHDTRVFESGDRACLLEVKLGIFGPLY